jgi:hypothetical protein
MKLFILAALLWTSTAEAQISVTRINPPPIQAPWRITHTKAISGALVFLAGASKGFNETLMFHWSAFHTAFPKANANWFNPQTSWKNKYREGDPVKGAKFPMSTTALVLVTDQYHFDNFINRTCWMSAIMLQMSEGRKSFKHYLLDMIYYTACHQLGFAMAYYPFNKKGGR